MYEKFHVLGAMRKVAHSKYLVHQGDTSGCNLGDGEVRGPH